MSRKIILTCDVCGCEGHESTEPDHLCIIGLQEQIRYLKNREAEVMKAEVERAFYKP